MELALDEPAEDHQVATIEFQSLFSWNLLLMQRQQATFAGQWAVSILVFVELALDEGLLGARRPLSMI